MEHRVEHVRTGASDRLGRQEVVRHDTDLVAIHFGQGEGFRTVLQHERPRGYVGVVARPEEGDIVTSIAPDVNQDRGGGVDVTAQQDAGVVVVGPVRLVACPVVHPHAEACLEFRLGGAASPQIEFLGTAKPVGRIAFVAGILVGCLLQESRKVVQAFVLEMVVTEDILDKKFGFKLNRLCYTQETLVYCY